jgi:hypothetical protein
LPDGAVLPASPPQADVVPLRWPGRAGVTERAVDAERRRRREAAVPATPEPAPLMRDELRRRGMLRIPDEEQDAQPGADRDQA